MLTTITTAIAQSAILGWLFRRAQEIASFAGILLPIYLAMPPDMQAVVHAVFTGQGGGLTVSAYVSFGYYLWTQWQSYRATVRPQVVTTDGQKRILDKGTAPARQADAVAAAAPPPRTLWDRLTSR